jgi:hypothetical protein
MFVGENKAGWQTAAACRGLETEGRRSRFRPLFLSMSVSTSRLSCFNVSNPSHTNPSPPVAARLPPSTRSIVLSPYNAPPQDPRRRRAGSPTACQPPQDNSRSRSRQKRSRQVLSYGPKVGLGWPGRSRNGPAGPKSRPNPTLPQPSCAAPPSPTYFALPTPDITHTLSVFLLACNIPFCLLSVYTSSCSVSALLHSLSVSSRR